MSSSACAAFARAPYDGESTRRMRSVRCRSCKKSASVGQGMRNMPTPDRARTGRGFPAHTQDVVHMTKRQPSVTNQPVVPGPFSTLGEWAGLVSFRPGSCSPCCQCGSSVRCEGGYRPPAWALRVDQYGSWDCSCSPEQGQAGKIRTDQRRPGSCSACCELGLELSLRQLEPDPL